MGNFVILIGGPGLFKGCDKTHDQSWTNYIVPLQLAAQRNLYRKQPSEVIHWVLYEPPYRKRWLDDSVITEEEKKQIDGYHLHSIRKAAADRILAKGALSYIDRIKMIKFYGCYTNSFAKEWNSIFGAGAAGAKEKIDFGVVDRPSNIVNIMERIEKTPTSVGNPDWTVHN
jgi:hypothetical protein